MYVRDGVNIDIQELVMSLRAKQTEVILFHLKQTTVFVFNLF